MENPPTKLPPKLKAPPKAQGKRSRGPPQNKEITVYVTSLQKVEWRSAARKRGVSVSQLIKMAMYELIYRTDDSTPDMIRVRYSEPTKHDIPILRLDRTPNPQKGSQLQADFKKMIKEGIRPDAINRLAKVPEEELHHYQYKPGSMLRIKVDGVDLGEEEEDNAAE